MLEALAGLTVELKAIAEDADPIMRNAAPESSAAINLACEEAVVCERIQRLIGVISLHAQVSENRWLEQINLQLSSRR